MRPEEHVFNATFEKYPVMINSHMFNVEPRSVTMFPYDYAAIIESDPEYMKKGLVVMREGDDFKEKERKALLAYIERLDSRIQNFQSWMDEEKKRGSTITEKPIQMKQAEKWKEQILTKLNLEKPIVEEKSFLDAAHVKTEVEEQFPQVDPVEFAAKQRKPGKPKKSLVEALEKELG